MRKVKKILDINNFWSPSGGGVRRYHLEKMEYYQKRQDEFKLIFLMQDNCNRTEEISPTLTIEHVKALKIPGKWWEYRFIYSAKQIKPYIEKFKPDIIEVGSPYILPTAVSRACKDLNHKPVLVGFWHADFPVTYIRNTFQKISKTLAKMLENIAWAYARFEFKNYKGIQVSSNSVAKRMELNGLNNLCLMPLGIDADLFSPSCKDNALVEELKAGEPNRLTMFFPHRFTKEKGLPLLLDAYPLICKKLGLEPSLVFAGTGNKIHLVKKAEKKYKHIKYIGFINNQKEMAKWYASSEIGFALSSFETFGFSILESMACGEHLISANAGAAQEHIKESGGGIILQDFTPQALAEAICSFDKNQLSSPNEKGRAYALKFTWDACFEKQREFYRNLIS